MTYNHEDFHWKYLSSPPHINMKNVLRDICQEISYSHLYSLGTTLLNGVSYDVGYVIIERFDSHFLKIPEMKRESFPSHDY